MILKESYNPERIAQFRKRKEFNKTDPAIIEKMIRALVLLEHLSESELDFIFKGGTCLVLLLKQANRFSIDIDILTSESRQNLENILDQIITNSDFISYKLDEKRSYKSGIPKAHYKFYWTEDKKDYILLDILFEKHAYPQIIDAKIETDWLITKEPIIKVKVPSKESILGDKLTAFAPNTIGVPYGKNKETEIIKQLFDVSVLINEVSDINIVHKSFYNIALNEIKYRNLDITPDDVLDDIFTTALLLSKREKNSTEPDKSKFKELQTGIRSFNNFLIRDSFRIEHTIEASAKVVWFATKLKYSDFSSLELYNSKTTELKEWNISDTNFNHIQKFKRTNKVAYYYWVECLNKILK